MAVAYHGGCRCGQIRYACHAAPIVVTLGYCRDCQRWSGGACGNYVSMPATAVTRQGHTTGYSVQAESPLEVRREFYPVCGSPVFTTTPHLLTITVDGQSAVMHPRTIDNASESDTGLQATKSLSRGESDGRF